MKQEILSITPEALTALEAMAAAPSGEATGQTWAELCQSMADDDHGPLFDASTGILVQPVAGVIGRGASAEDEVFEGMFNSERIEAAAAFAADPRVKAFVLALNTPGGFVAGGDITAGAIQKLREARPDMPVVALATGLCCSMGYRFAVACDKIHCLPGARIGNVGVSAVITDTSEAYKQLGIDRQLVTDGKYKGMGTPGIKWTAAWRDAVKTGVSEASDAFKSAVKAARPGVSDGDLEGQDWAAEKAPAGVHDGIPAATAAEYLAQLAAALTAGR